MTLTADQASHAAFVTTRFKAGYDLEEVDVFIESIAAALRAWETGPVSGPSYRILASDDVSSKKFSTTSLREGYEQDAIDLFMDEAARTLQDHETRARGHGAVGPGGYGIVRDPNGEDPSGQTAAAGQTATMATADWVQDMKFQATKFREGYEQDEIDEYLDELVATLRAWETSAATGGPPPHGVQTSSDVRNKKFQGTKFREGYEQDEVDKFLDYVMNTLRAYETRSGAGGYGIAGPVGAPDSDLNAGPPDQSWTARTIATEVTADRVSHMTLKRVTWKKAYNLEEIDACMQEIVAALRAWEASAMAGGPPPHGVLTSSDLLNKKFNITKFRQEGYEQDQVDEFLDEVVEVLKAYESRGLR